MMKVHLLNRNLFKHNLWRNFEWKWCLLFLVACSFTVKTQGNPIEKTFSPSILQKTAGGKQFWGDVHYFHGYRIQRNVITGHFRLLDPKNYRLTFGRFESCLTKLKAIAQKKQLGPMRGKVVIMIHGIGRSVKTFSKAKDAFSKAGYHPILFSYPSTRMSIVKSAKYLKLVIQSLQGVEEIHFLTHSMGGLLVRAYLLDPNKDPRISRMVMVATPNQGAILADQVKNWKIFQVFWGPAGQQLGTSADNFISKLPVPPFEFGIIAGGRGNNKGYNPIIPGDDDGVVGVENTKLNGAADFNCIRSIHTTICSHPDVISQAIRFLQGGAFRPSGIRQPIGK